MKYFHPSDLPLYVAKGFQHLVRVHAIKHPPSFSLMFMYCTTDTARVSTLIAAAFALVARKHEPGQVFISSTKSMMGHTLGAAGGLEAIVCAQVLRHGEIPPTKNLENPALEDGCDLNYCPGEKVGLSSIGIVLSII